MTVIVSTVAAIFVAWLLDWLAGAVRAVVAIAADSANLFASAAGVAAPAPV